MLRKLRWLVIIHQRTPGSVYLLPTTLVLTYMRKYSRNANLLIRNLFTYQYPRVKIKKYVLILYSMQVHTIYLPATCILHAEAKEIYFEIKLALDEPDRFWKNSQWAGSWCQEPSNRRGLFTKLHMQFELHHEYTLYHYLFKKSYSLKKNRHSNILGISRWN